MIVFCPNCGTQNPGLPGARATCTACASIFEVPFDAGRRPAPAEPAPTPQGFAAPDAQLFWPPPVAAPSFEGTGVKTSRLAIASLVMGIICCIPLVSPLASIGCGVVALKQIDASGGAQTGKGLAIAGLILGGLTALVQLLWLIGVLSRQF